MTQQGSTPEHWWNGLEVNLGEATSPRMRSPAGLWTRCFPTESSSQLEPGAATQTIVLPNPMKTVLGETVSSVTLAASHGAILHN